MLSCFKKKEETDEEKSFYDKPDARQTLTLELNEMLKNNPAPNSPDVIFRAVFPDIYKAIESKQFHSDIAYNINPDKKRIALIYNHVTYKDQSYGPRKGTEKDVHRLDNLLKKLNFEVFLFENKTESQIFDSVITIRHEQKQILSESDSMMVFILTHGEKDNKLMAYDRDYDFFQFMEKFTPALMEDMAEKPKLFFIQACRGGKIDDGIKIKNKKLAGSSFNNDKHEPEFYTHPLFADFFVGFSSHHEHFSFRNDEGSWFIQELCNTIENLIEMETLNRTDIYDIMTLTNRNVAKRESQADPGNRFYKKKQVSAFYSTLVRKYYLSK